MTAAKSGEHRIEIPHAEPSGVRRKPTAAERIAARNADGKQRRNVGYRPPALRLVEEPGRLYVGEGERYEDCHNYTDCLDNFVRAHKHDDPDAHCPQECSHFRPIPRHSLVAAAMIQPNTDDMLPASSDCRGDDGEDESWL